MRTDVENSIFKAKHSAANGVFEQIFLAGVTSESGIGLAIHLTVKNILDLNLKLQIFYTQTRYSVKKEQRG